MFSFIGTIFGKIASVVTSVFVAVGLVSAPASIAPPQLQPIENIIETAIPETSAIVAPSVEEKKEVEIDVKAELDALKKQLAEEQKKRKDLEKKVVAPAPKPAPAPTPTPQVASVVPPVIITPPPAPTPVTPKVQLLPGHFMLPSGAVIDSTGKIVTPAPTEQPIPSTSSQTTTVQATTTTPAPAPIPTWPPAEGATVDIQRSILSIINFNPQLTCDQLLALPPSKKNLCKLYKDNEGNSKYTWHIIEDL